MSGRRIYFNIRNKISCLLNPALCLSCGIPIRAEELICEICFSALQQVQNPCTGCGLPQKYPGRLCPTCLHHHPDWQHMIAPLVYTGSVRQIMQDYKFNEQIHLANALLSCLYGLYQQRPVEILIPVPLHPLRLLERGFNQSNEIAQVLSRYLNIPVDNTSLQRIKSTQSQSGLSLNKRRKNLLKAFAFSPQQPYQSVALIDDVITSGSTLSEICKQLKKSGIEHIEVWSLARTLRHE
ncbi:MAG: ComF family protein [Gammaproteobacteria bacterium]|nr:ComF family protein [Gammaproteobacteria bacterium]